jgi:hypothetical protein
MTLQLPVSSSEFSENAHSFFRKFVSRTISNKNVNGSVTLFCGIVSRTIAPLELLDTRYITPKSVILEVT